MTGRVDPFVGLAPYGEQDAEWFFGREREVELIVANLRAARLTLLYGSSGVGKSSVLLAGALPRLRAIQDADREDARALAAHGGAALAERPTLAIAIVRDWAQEPLVRLAVAVHAAVVDATGDQEIEPWNGDEPFATWLRDQAREVRTLLVVLDQFEEYFMYHPDEDGPGTLAAELPNLLGDNDLRVNFLLGMREDALFRLDRFKGRIPDLFGNYLRLDYLERDAARGAIKKPVDHFNATVRAGRPPVDVDDAVIEAVLDGVRAGRLALHGSADPGPAEVACTRVETPYLQLVMRRLWAAGTADGGLEVTRRTLDDLGGAAVIVSNHLGQAMGELSDGDQAIAADVFRYLVSSSRTKIAYAAEDLAVFAGWSAEDVTRVLQELADSDRRVLRAVPGTSKGDPLRYELYHDVLAEAVQEWATRNQEGRSLLEARRARRRRWRKRVLIGFAWVLCAWLAVVYVPRLLDDGGERVSTPIAQKLADHARLALDSDPERSVLLALAAYDRAPDDAESVLREAVTASRVRAAHKGGETRPCGAGCAGISRHGKPDPVAVSMDAARTARTYDPYLGYASQVEGGQWMSVAPDGRTVAVVRKGAVELWTPRRQDQPVRELAGLDDVKQAAFIGTHGRLLLVTKKGGVRVAGSGNVERIAKRASLVAASAGGRYVATAHAEGVVRVLDLRTGDRTRLQPGRRVTSLAFNPTNARQLAVGVKDPEGIGVKLTDWRSGDGTRLDAGDRYPGDAEGRFNGNGRRILVTVGAGHPKVFKNDTTHKRVRSDTARLDFVTGVRWLGPWVAGTAGNLVKLSGATVLGGHEFPVRAMAASPNGALIATGSDDGSARVWDAYSGNQMLELRAGGAPVTSVAFTPGGRFLVTGDAERAVRIWAVSTGRDLPYKVALGTDFDRDGSLIGVGYDGRLAAWTPSGDRSQKLGRVSASAYGYQVAPDARTVAFVDYGRRRLVVRSFDGRDRNELRSVDAFVLSGDGTRVLLLGARPRLVDPAGNAQAVRLGDSKRVYTGAVSRDNDKVLLAGRRMQVFDVDEPDRPVTLKGRADSGAFNPAGDRVVTGGREARVFDSATGKRIAVLEGHVGPVLTAGYSPDGTKIVTGGADRTVRIWDSTTFDQIGVIEGFDSELMQAKLDWSGHRLLTETFYSRPEVVECTPCLEPDDLTELASANVTRDLTRAEKKEAGLPR